MFLIPITFHLYIYVFNTDNISFIQRDINALEADSEDVFKEAFQKASNDHNIFADIESEEWPADIPSIRHDVLGIHTDKIYMKASL